ncbi:hypothetical protein GCM10023160_23310 [Brachybacterium paraconglomeratum]
MPISTRIASSTSPSTTIPSGTSVPQREVESVRAVEPEREDVRAPSVVDGRAEAPELLRCCAAMTASLLRFLR